MSKKLFMLAALSIASGGFLHAQEDTSSNQLDEVVITATKFPKKTSETGKVVTVIGSQVLERSAGKDLPELLTEQAGLVINGATSNPGKDKSVFLRGAKNDYTVILVNGIPVTDPSGVGGAFDLRMIPIEQVERIEILKGAQSTLYGSDAIAGVINIITKKGAPRPAELSANISLGSYRNRKLYAGLQGQAEKVSYSTGFTHLEAAGISEASDTTASKSFDKDGMLQNGFHLNIDGEVSNGFHVKPFFRYTYFKGDFDEGAFTDAANKFRSSLLSAGVISQWKFAKGSLTGQYAYDEVNRRYTTSFGITDFIGNNKLAELFGQYSFNDNFQVLAGIDHRIQHVSDTNASPKDPTIRITSPYVSLFLRDLAGFNLELGGRYNKHSKYGDNFTYSINPSVVLGKHLKVFANIASAFKAPPISSLYGQFGANPELMPERSQTYEGGIQAGLPEDKLRARFVYFSRKTKDIVIYGPAFTYINLDEQNDHGVEIEPAWQVNEALQLKAYYTYVDGEVRSAVNGKDTSYDNLVRKPRHSFGLTAGYQLTKRLYISTNVYTYGKRDDIFFNLSTFVQEPVRLKAYTLWNAYAEYTVIGRHLRVFADLQNIMDANYYETYGYSTQGFNVNAGISLRW